MQNIINQTIFNAVKEEYEVDMYVEITCRDLETTNRIHSKKSRNYEIKGRHYEFIRLFCGISKLDSSSCGFDGLSRSFDSISRNFDMANFKQNGLSKRGGAAD